MNEPIKIQLNKDDILILKTDVLIHPKDLEKIRKNVADQAKEGTVIIPHGFSYEILKTNQIKDEIIPSGKAGKWE